jgi:hypothetical protein
MGLDMRFAFLLAFTAIISASVRKRLHERLVSRLYVANFEVASITENILRTASLRTCATTPPARASRKMKRCRRGLEEQAVEFKKSGARIYKEV